VKRLTVFRFVWAAFIVAATSAPYLLNALSTPPGYHYTWIIPPYPEDSFGYAAWAQQAAHGAWLFKIKYTALPHSAFLFHPFFLICGWLAALFSCDVGIVFFVAKALGVILFFAIFYRYIDYLGLDTLASVLASVLVGVSSGLGGLFGFTGWSERLSILIPLRRDKNKRNGNRSSSKPPSNADKTGCRRFTRRESSKTFLPALRIQICN